MRARRVQHPVATQSVGSRRLLQDPQPEDAGPDAEPPDPESEPGDGGDQSMEDPGALAPAGDSEEGGGVEQESPDLLHGACTNHSELLGSAHAILCSTASNMATLQTSNAVMCPSTLVVQLFALRRTDKPFSTMHGYANFHLSASGVFKCNRCARRHVVRELPALDCGADEGF